ncbi:hypothetical protein COX53_03395 [candidate division WWE3 bacterium CG23_combo_of_CG06-09_8_20_14_all_40_14]|uniref:EamA domain-containing protein n=1 Tax=candidate division WWE3 bacterium CG23_combo_of_CG06-09_8_20_14_all_40_14 TaxID=1975095 RepID=A0A2G9XCP6_UNCKA|nr:MAG: hypothetical protein COX53_03395 [candidate division WWE3 bacterium CG23_combo_of_CG06-09_8_20_14_all_40_14]
METGIRSRKWGWSSLRTNATALALIAALFSALFLVNDTNILHNIIVSENKRVAILVYLTLGSWVGVLANLVYNKLFGRFIEPAFSRERWVSSRVQLYSFMAGSLAAVSTFVYLTVAGEGDPSILIALSCFSIMYLAVYDHLKAREKLRGVVSAGLLVLVGAALVAVQDMSAGIHVTLKALFLLLLVKSALDAVSRVFEKEIVKESGSVNLAFWRFLWLAVTATILAFAWASFAGIRNVYLELLGSLWLKALPWVALTMLLAYGGNTFRILAQRYGNVSTVAIVGMAQVAIAVPLTLVIAGVAPSGTFTLPTDPKVWAVRFVGTILITFGILLCPKAKKEKETD